jgi:hypothetical protein
VLGQEPGIFKRREPQWRTTRGIPAAGRALPLENLNMFLRNGLPTTRGATPPRAPGRSILYIVPPWHKPGIALAIAASSLCDKCMQNSVLCSWNKTA